MSQHVHVIPVSHEVDRVVLPFLPKGDRPARLEADRVVLLVPQGIAAARIATAITRRLEAIVPVETVPLGTARESGNDGFATTLSTISHVIAKEFRTGNQVHVNLSSGTKMVCVAAGMAGMAHVTPDRGSMYYVHPAGHSITKADFENHGRTKGVLQVDELGLVPIAMPTPDQLRVIAYLWEQPGHVAAYRDLLAYLSKFPEAGFRPASVDQQRRLRGWNNAETTRMVRTILTPLQALGLADIVASGRVRSARLTGRGAMFAALAAPTSEELLPAIA